MDWLNANWIWILLIGVMLWMHLRMHRGHGGHGGCGGSHAHRDTEHHRSEAREHDPAAGMPGGGGP